ncbi:MAG: GGDEF domain-containing protein [Myxococcaceae bacterium]|nr:GGDEF domain-containing protein [Myxococcaceae bacterium]
MSAELVRGIDLLTGALSREAFEAVVARAVHEARRDGRVLSLLWIDVDELCELNDIHGRDALDASLSWLATRLSRVIDGRGPIGRVEGGAFAALLPDVTRDAALVLSDQIRRAIPRLVHSSAFGDYRIAVSVGVASLKPTEPWGNFLEAAEMACRRAKQGGRDAVVAR